MPGLLRQSKQKNMQDPNLDPNTVIKSNLMNSKVNKRAKILPDHLKLNGTTPSGLPRLFVCKVCTRAFSRQEHLTRHERSHTNERPYECGICDRNFTRRDLLLRHALKVHNGNLGENILKTRRKTKGKSVTSRKNSVGSTASTNNTTSDSRSRRASVTNKKHITNNTSETNSMLTYGVTQNTNLPSSKSSISPANLTDSSSLTPTPGSTTYDWNLNESTNPKFRKSRNSNKKNTPSSPLATNNINNTNNPTELFHPLPKRRASFSAQSAENYALPLYHPTNLPSLDKVQFSTPTLVPLDLYNIFDFDDINNNFSYDLTNEFPGQTSSTSSSSSSSLENKRDEMGSNNTQNSLKYPIKLEQVLENVPIQFNLDDIEPLNINININNNNNSNNNSLDDITENEGDNNEIQNENSNDNTHSFNLNYNHSIDQNNISNNIISPAFKAFKFDGISTTQTPLTLVQDPGSVNQLESTNELKSTCPVLTSTMSISPLNPNDLIGYLHNDSDVHMSETALHNDVTVEDHHYMPSPVKPTVEVPSLFENIYNDYMTKERNNITQKQRGSTGNKDNDYSFYGVDYLTLANISKASPKDNTRLNQITKTANPLDDGDNTLNDMFNATLFNGKLHKYCHMVIRYYLENYGNSHNGYSDPNFIAKDLLLPSCHELNNFLTLFRENFLIHYPFIHESLLNCDFLSLQRYLYEDISLDESQVQFHKNGDILNMARSVCLPLLMATMGSLFKKGSHPKTIILYEISRRALHVFLELEKSNCDNNYSLNNITKTDNTQCTWLVQVFILNIIFALFADEVKNIKSDVVVRQVNAICSVLRKNYLSFVSIESLPIDPFTSQSQEITFPNSFQLLLFESRIRSTLMLYEYCQYLDICYNIHSKSFLNEKDIENLCIPEDEIIWRCTSLTDVNSSTGVTSMKKVHCVPFKEFYNSFGFNNSGFYAIPESLAKTMMFYEFKCRKTSPFHIFLTRIDTRKLEMNISSGRMLDNDYDSTPASLIKDSTTLKNCLMVMIFLNEVDKDIGNKIWNGEMRLLFDTFLDSRNYNMLTNCSYHLLTDFLVALNYSIQNISRLLLPDEYASKDLFIDRKKLTIFNLQGFYYNFLIILKFMLDFESTPNFKLLCIFTDLNNMADKFLIPLFSSFYSSEFQMFDTGGNVDKENSYSIKNIETIEKTINDVLVYSFNDASFLNMNTQNKTNEFWFHPTLETNINSGAFDNNDGTQICSASSINLLKIYNSSSNHGAVNKQTFAERYQLSLKFIVVAKCFFSILTEHYSHCDILKKMIGDFENLERILKQESNQLGLSKLKLST